MKLQKWLDEVGMSQNAFAKLIPTSAQNVNGWCRARCIPGLWFIRRISEITKNRVSERDFTPKERP